MAVADSVIFRNRGSKSFKVFLILDLFEHGIADEIRNGLALKLCVLANDGGIHVIDAHGHS